MTATGVTRTSASVAASTLRAPAGADRRPGAPRRRPRPRSSRPWRSPRRARRPGSAARAGWRCRRPRRGSATARGMPGRRHQVEPVAQPERDALEHGPGEVPPVVARASGRRTLRAPADRGAGCARRSGTAGRTGRRCPAGPPRPSRRGRRTRRRAPARRGTSAGCRPPRASPTSCASGRARRGRRRGPDPRGS